MLDVKYDQETFLKKKSEIEKNAAIQYEMSGYNYTGVAIESPQNVIYGIYFIAEENIIRYAAICGKGVDDVGINTQLMWNSSVDWTFPK